MKKIVILDFMLLLAAFSCTPSPPMSSPKRPINYKLEGVWYSYPLDEIRAMIEFEATEIRYNERSFECMKELYPPAQDSEVGLSGRVKYRQSGDTIFLVDNHQKIFGTDTLYYRIWDDGTLSLDNKRRKIPQTAPPFYTTTTFYRSNDLQHLMSEIGYHMGNE